MIFYSLFISLTLTLLFELPITYLAKIPFKLALLVNLLTNPVVVILYFWADFLSLPLPMVVLVLEAFAILTEAYYYRDAHKRPLIFSFCVNLFSYSLGVIFTAIT